MCQIEARFVAGNWGNKSYKEGDEAVHQIYSVFIGYRADSTKPDARSPDNCKLHIFDIIVSCFRYIMLATERSPL